MELNKLTVDLIKELEYIVGKNVYNKATKNHETDENGDMIRYPCRMKDPKDDVIYKYKGKLYDATPESITWAFYKFGANNLNIGDALIELLEYLEDRYNLDFNQLEDFRLINNDYNPNKSDEEDTVDCDAYDDE
jgi:hypothetical protein